MAVPPELLGTPHCRRWGRDACLSTAPAPCPTKFPPRYSGSPSYREDVPSPSLGSQGASAPAAGVFRRLVFPGVRPVGSRQGCWGVWRKPPRLLLEKKDLGLRRCPLWGPWPLAATPGPVFACPRLCAAKGDVTAFTACWTPVLLKESQC